MTKKFILMVVTGFLLIACDRMTPKADPELAEIHQIIETKPDSALHVLETMTPAKSFSDYDQAYYNILLSSARVRSGEVTVESDSLLNIAIHSLSEWRDYELLALAYLNKGRIWSELGDPELAIQSLRKALNLLEIHKNPDLELISKIYDDMGNIYLGENSYNEAMEYFRKEYALDEKIGDPRGRTFSLRNIGWTFLLQNEIDSAYIYFQNALEQAKLASDSIYLRDFLYNDLSMYFWKIDKYGNSLNYLEKITDKNDKYLYNKALILYQQEKTDNALEILQQISNFENPQMKVASYNYISLILYKKEDYQRAYDYHEKYAQLTDSIYQQDKANDLWVMDYKYQVERETTRIKNLYQQRGLVGLFLALSLSGIFIYILTLRKKQRLRKERKQKRQNEKDMMQIERALFVKEQELNVLELHVEKAQNEMQLLREEGPSDQESHKEQLEAKEKEIAQLKIDIETKRFTMTPAYDRLKLIEKELKSGIQTKIKMREQIRFIKNSEYEELYSDLERAFGELIDQVKKTFPTIKKEDIFILCLTKAQFSSTIIGAYLNISSSAVRHQAQRIRSKVSFALEKT